MLLPIRAFLLCSLLPFAFSQIVSLSKQGPEHLTLLGNSPVGPVHRQKRGQEPDVNWDRAKVPQEVNDNENEVNLVNTGKSDKQGNDPNPTDEYSDGDGEYEEIDFKSEMESSNNILREKKDELHAVVGNNDELKKLMSESAELAKQVGGMFESLAQREVQLLQEMQVLKDKLNGAVEKLQKQETANRMRREINSQSKNGGPYKACVSIESVGDGQNNPAIPLPPGAAPRPYNAGSKIASPSPPTVQEYMPPPNFPPPPPPRPKQPGNDQGPSKGPGRMGPPNPNQPSGGDDVNLSHVYWLRQDPKQKQEALHQKVGSILSKEHYREKDVLVIPVNHKFTSSDQVKNSFLHAVRVRPEALKGRSFRQLRSLQITEF